MLVLADSEIVRASELLSFAASMFWTNVYPTFSPLSRTRSRTTSWRNST
jgi:hypothetical protein